MGPIADKPQAASIDSNAPRRASGGWWWWIVTPAVFCLLAAAVWMRLHASEAREMADQQRAKRDGRPVPVRTELVAFRDFDDVNGATGITQASKSAVVRMGTAIVVPERQVAISKVHVKHGQRVNAGDTLFDLDDSLYRLTHKQRQTAHATAEQEYNAIERLVGERAASGFQLRRAQVELELAALELEMAERDLKRSQITSPIDGFVDLINAVQGEQVDASRDLTTVYSLDPIFMHVDVPQERIAETEIGQQAEVVLDSFPQETFAGKLIALSPQVDTETRVLSAVLEIPNPEHKIKAGISGFARFRTHKEGVAVPMAAVIEIDRKAMAFVVEKGVAHMREVRTGQIIETGITEVVAGLDPGEEVVIFGQQYLEDGDEVDVNWRRWARRE